MRFRITCAVEKAEGQQTWVVNAKNEKEALGKHEAGRSEFEGEEIEITSLGPPEIEEIEETEE